MDNPYKKRWTPSPMDMAIAYAVMQGEDPATAFGNAIVSQAQQQRDTRLLSAALDGERSLARTRQTKAARLIREAMDILGVDLEDLEDVAPTDGGAGGQHGGAPAAAPM